jgi:hypothetical protein
LFFFPGLASAFLDATDQLFLLALGKSQIVIGELRKFLFQLAPGNVPVSFDCESAHIILNLILVAACFRAIKAVTTKYLLQVTCRPAAVMVFPQNKLHLLIARIPIEKSRLIMCANCKPQP